THTVGTIARPVSGGREGLVARRLLVVALNLASVIGLAWIMASLIGFGGWSWLQALILLLFLAGLPWTLLAFWNSVIGFVILRLARDPAGYTNPALGATPTEGPIVGRIAICLPVRHEDVGRVVARLEAMVEEIEACRWRDQFDFHLLSDSSRPEIAAAEEQAFAALAARHPRPGFLSYRRRPVNLGFKAGNLRELAERTRGRYDFMVVLDADSLMSAAAILRLVRAMHANPSLRILQPLL